VHFLQLNISLDDTRITIDDINHAYNTLNQVIFDIDVLKQLYDAKTISLVKPADAKRLTKDSAHHTRSILFKNSRNTLCVLAYDEHQKHYYEFNQKTKVFDYTDTSIKFIEPYSGSEKDKKISRLKQTFFRLINEGLSVNIDQNTYDVQIDIDDNKFNSLRPVFYIPNGFIQMLKQEFDIRSSTAQIYGKQSGKLLAVVLTDQIVIKKRR